MQNYTKCNWILKHKRENSETIIFPYLRKMEEWTYKFDKYRIHRRKLVQRVAKEIYRDISTTNESSLTIVAQTYSGIRSVRTIKLNSPLLVSDLSYINIGNKENDSTMVINLCVKKPQKQIRFN